MHLKVMSAIEKGSGKRDAHLGGVARAVDPKTAGPRFLGMLKELASRQLVG
jgi:hypothetical protein